ncbi:MAG: diacylglycerol kinase family lipid kinase [bacterium]|nr:diacylglycerol kinase family lipid kinase [bacterium]
MKITIVANPWAARGRGEAFIADFESALREAGFPADVVMTRGPGDATGLARECARGSDVVGIIGGDGTVHEVINGLMPNPPPIVIVPAGTGNDFASLMGCPTTPREFIKVVEDGFGARIDILDLGSCFCANSCGLGFEGQVNQVSHRITRLKGSFLYLAATFRALVSLRTPWFKLQTAEGETLEGEYLMVSVGNGNRAGGAFYLTPDAYPDDGLIDVCLVRRMSRLKILALLPKTFSGKHVTHPDVTVLRTGHLTIETEGEHPMHIDGELIPVAPPRLEIRLLPRVLPVLCKRDTSNRLRSKPGKILSG